VYLNAGLGAPCHNKVPRRHLSLCCNLSTHVCFIAIKFFILFTEMKRLRHLDISYNILNSALQHIPIATQLNYINLSATVSHDPSPIVSLLQCKLPNHVSYNVLYHQWKSNYKRCYLSPTFNIASSYCGVSLKGFC